MQKQYQRPPVRRQPVKQPVRRPKKRKRKSTSIYGSLNLSVILACVAILAVFIIIAVVSHRGESVATSVFGFDDDVTICVDAGHGYDDPGALSDYLGDQSEKDINLTAALMLAEKLKELGFEVIMTRDSDTPPEGMEPDSRGLYTMNPNERTAWLKKQDCDLFISLHCNVAQNSNTVTGTLIYYCSPALEQSEGYAKALTRILGQEMPLRSVEPIDTRLGDSFAVIRDVKMPSVLVEMGFISSPDDSVLLLDDGWMDSFTSALANGISSYVADNRK